MPSAVLAEPLPSFALQEPSLSTRAMLCSLSISMWSARKHDPEASEEIAARHKAQPGVGRYNKVLLPKEALAEIQKIVGEARHAHYFVTLPWGDDGYRVLPGAVYLEHTAKMREFSNRFHPAVETLVGRFTKLIEEARMRLGGLFREADYPHPQELRSRFAFETRVMPLPDAGDFRVALGDEEKERVKRQITASVEASLHVASRELWERLYDAVHHMAERLAAYKVTEDGVEHAFRDTVVTNLVRLVDVLPRLNVMRDPELERLAEEVRSFLLVDPKELRASESVRNETARAAAAIAERMTTYMSAYAILAGGM